MKNNILKMFAIATVVATVSVFANAATYTVTKVADTNDGACDSDCSLREAVAAANATIDNDTIQFEFPLFNSPQTIILFGGEIVIANNGSLTISGPGADRLTLDGNNASRILSNSPAAVTTVDGLLFTRGNGIGGAPLNSGGAILNNGGNFTITNSVVTGNTTSLSAGGLRNSGSGSSATIINCVFSNNTGTSSSGGAIQNFSTSSLTIEGSTFSGNSAAGSVGGGAIQANGQARITNSTFVGNTSSSSGGAIQSNGSLLLLTNVTISGNTSTSNGGGLHRSTTNVNGFIRNSIIAGNNGVATSPDVTNGANGLNSEGNNIIGTVGTSTGWEASDLLNTNPLLSPVGNYGGPGHTFALLSNSPAVNGGQNCVVDLTCTTNNPQTAVTTDQRGAGRPSDALVDIGAYESSTSYRAVLPNAVLNQGYGEIIVPNISGFNYSVSNGSLPPGLELVLIAPSKSDLGITALLAIFGTPTQAGTFDFSLTATDGTNSAVINYSLTVTGAAANVFVGGRVLNGGLGIVPNALLRITDGAAVNRTTRSNSFGNYRFADLTPSVPYTITVETKGLSFAPGMITPSVNVSNFDLSPTP